MLARRLASATRIGAVRRAMASIRVLTTEDSPEKASKIAAAARAFDDSASITTEAVQSYYWWEEKAL